MANQFATNFPYPAAANIFEIIWKLSRVMKAAGWNYRASSNGLIKDTTGIAANDLWGANANAQNDTYTNIGTQIAAGSNNTVLPQTTLNVTANGALTFPTSGTLQVSTTTGWSTVTYTGTTASTFTGCTGGTGTIYTGSEVGSGAISLEAAAGGPIAWWCASGPLTVKLPLSVIPTGTPVRGELVTQATTGAAGELFGFAWDPVGNSGWAIIGPQATPQSTTIASASNATALPTGTINVASTTGFGSTGYLNVWTSPQATTIASGSNGQSLPQGTINVLSVTGFPTATATAPGTIYITTASGTQTVTYTGTSGGNQFTGCSNGAGAMSTGGSVTGAQQLQQVAYTGTSGGNQFTGCTLGTGTMTTGNAVTGYSATFNNTNTLSGSISGTTITPTGTVTYYQREFVFAKQTASVLNGNIYYVCADGNAENAQLYSSLASSVGCTPVVGPAGGGTSNLIPNLGLVCRGNASSVTGDIWFDGSSVFNFGTNTQIAAVNNIPASTVTADGSFYIMGTTSAANISTGLLYSRLDDQEPGDVDPYVYMGVQQNAYASWTKNTQTSFASSSALFSSVNTGIYGSSAPCCFGYQARGVTGKDVLCGFALANFNSFFGNNTALVAGGVGAMKLLSHPATAPPIVREPYLVFAQGAIPGTLRQYKGRLRWLNAFPIGNTYDTFDNKTWLATTIYVVGQSTIAIGPYDGVTTPIP
jgi:hypothetical protein